MVAPAFPDTSEARRIAKQTVVVVPEDTLTTIAERSNTTVDRIFSANPQIDNPDLIEVGDKIRVPDETEQLADREPPQNVVGAAETQLSPEVVSYAPPTAQSVQTAPRAFIGGLVGSYGYALPYGNCVNEPGVNNPRDGTNPISWAVTSYQPWIGASALFYFNHVAVVSGLWPDGSIEVRHQNCPGCPTRYPASMIRGYR